ncbi:MAG: hypothetical protein PHU25_17175 [Deltaproteobacteria bacterium]|nr:hypothetical protein [Deltaproteobacteria bacterium]
MRSGTIVVLVVGLFGLAVGCGGSGSSDDDAGAASGSDTETDTGTADTDGDSDADADSDSDGDGDTDGECCTAPGQIAGCWNQDADRDGAGCTQDSECESKRCDTVEGICRPSWCNGFDVCSCWGGCDWGGTGIACGGSLPACPDGYDCKSNDHCAKPCAQDSDCLSRLCVDDPPGSGEKYCKFAPGDGCEIQGLDCCEGDYPTNPKGSGYCCGND